MLTHWVSHCVFWCDWFNLIGGRVDYLQRSVSRVNSELSRRCTSAWLRIKLWHSCAKCDALHSRLALAPCCTLFCDIKLLPQHLLVAFYSHLWHKTYAGGIFLSFVTKKLLPQHLLLAFHPFKCTLNTFKTIQMSANNIVFYIMLVLALEAFVLVLRL